MIKDPTLKAILDNKTAFYVQAVAAEEQANSVYLNAETNYDGKQLTYSMLNQDLASKLATLSDYETVMNNSETEWQNYSDDKAVADADLLDLKAKYATVFNAIQGAVAKVDDLENRLAQAKVDLANIPKPTATSKRVPKKTITKYFADGAYLPRATFMPNPK